MVAAALPQYLTAITWIIVIGSLLTAAIRLARTRKALTGRTGPAMADTMAPAQPEDIARLGLGRDHTDRAHRPSGIGGSPDSSSRSAAQGSGQANPDQDGRQ